MKKKEKQHSIEKKIKEFQSTLSLEQKVGQMFILGHQGDTVDERATSLIEEKYIGGFCFYRKNATSKSQLTGMTQALQTMAIKNQMGIPLFIAGDNEPGQRWSSMSHLMAPIPVAQEIPLQYTLEQAKSLFCYLAENLIQLGYNIDFAPVADINTNSKNPIIGERAFSADPQVVSDYVEVFIKSFREKGIISTAKHFPGHGDTTTDTHKESVHLFHSYEKVKERELIPFRTALHNNVEMIMTAHIIFDAIDSRHPATLSPKILTDILRQKMGYEGIIISDDMYMSAIYKHYDIKQALIQAINAGLDIVLCAQIKDEFIEGAELYDAVLAAVKDKRIPENRVEESVFRILKLKATTPVIQKIWGPRCTNFLTSLYKC